MRISDWSSDVCSSDLLGTPVVIDVDHAADREAREVVRGREGGVEMLAADIVEIDVYPRLAEAFERGGELRQHRSRLVIDRRVGAEVEDPFAFFRAARRPDHRSEEHTSELQSLMRISYAVFCLKKKKTQKEQQA